jgi:hypothetical protein
MKRILEEIANLTEFYRKSDYSEAERAWKIAMDIKEVFGSDILFRRKINLAVNEHAVADETNCPNSRIKQRSELKNGEIEFLMIS